MIRINDHLRLTGTVGLKKEKENANVALPRINVVKIKKTLPLLPDSTNAVVSLFFCNFFPAPLGRENDRRFQLQNTLVKREKENDRRVKIASFDLTTASNKQNTKQHNTHHTTHIPLLLHMITTTN